jgi:4-amino-4-deoxy-L-arabinose transferase-like glycosyltransferase
MFGRGYWTPDEPREADIAWRMSWQRDLAVPLLAGEAFCEKPPLTYWLSAVPIKLFGPQAWAARLPNLLYAVITALSIGALATRCAGRLAGGVAAAAMATLLLSYQTAIWLATDAPLLAAVSVALLGAYRGYHATHRAERLRGYLLMHAALGVGFLCKSAAAWMVPALTLLTLSLWERRLRELMRWELYLIELPVYLFPWTLLVAAAVRRAWRARDSRADDFRAVRFGTAIFLPSLAVLSIAATARNIYLAPALPGVALLLAWWVKTTLGAPDAWDAHALRGTAALLLISAILGAAGVGLAGFDGWATMSSRASYLFIAFVGLGTSVSFALRAWGAARTRPLEGHWSLLVAYVALLTLPASQLYAQVDQWQDLRLLGQVVAADTDGKPLILLEPDETTRAFVDMYASPRATLATTPAAAAAAAVAQHGFILVQLPGRAGPRQTRLAALHLSPPNESMAEQLPWLAASPLQIVSTPSLPNGRRYALLEPSPSLEVRPSLETGPH